MRGPATLTQLGGLVGHHPAWVRHHILSLEQAGLVELVETRPTKGYVEKFYCDLLARSLREDETGPDVITMAMGSLEGLIALRHGIGHVAGCHLFDAETGDFNRAYARALFPTRALVLVTLAHRQQGLMVARGNPRGIEDLAAAVEAGARLVNRNRGSGTRVWLDRLLAMGNVDPARVPGYEHEVMTHDAAARAVAEGTADVALGILPAATAHDLDFVPLVEERYDLVTPREHYESALLAPLLSLLDDDSFRRAVDDLGGYVTRETGAVTALA
jgi:putative molybdopterin biosynthesis protein